MNSAKPTPWEMTDTANADRLIDHAAGKLLYCADMGRWLAWDGTRWQISGDDGPAYEAATETIHAITPGDSEALAKWKLRSLSRNRLDAMVALARRRPALRVNVDQLDAHPHQLNTPSGIVDLETGRITPCSPELFHTKVTGCGIQRNGHSAMWKVFLDTTFGGDQQLIDYMQRLAGLAAIGQVREHVLPFCFGTGANGKGVFLDVLLGVLGDYAITTAHDFLLAGRGSKHETEIARLRGARLVICSEVNEGSKFDEAKVKLLTGGDKLSGRFMRCDLFDFAPSHTLFLRANYLPAVEAGGPSFWRRLRQIPFTYTVPEGERIPDMAAMLVRDEGPSILAWIVEGAQQVLAAGLEPTPAAVKAATEDYAEDSLTGVARFVDECCIVGTRDNIVDVSTLHACYKQWAFFNDEPPVSQKAFGRRLTSCGVPKAPRSAAGRRYYIKVRTDKLPSKLVPFGEKTALDGDANAV